MISVPQSVLETICASFEINSQRLVFMGGGREYSDGVVYAYPYQNVSRVLKIGALKESDTGGFLRMEERLKFVHFLGEQGVNIVFPIARTDGSLFATTREGENIFVGYIMEKAGGSHPRSQPWEASLVHGLGKTIGRLHRITQQFPTGQCTVIDPATGKPVLGWEQEWQDFYDWSTDSEVKRRWLEMRERLEALPVTRDGFGFIHNDPHGENILVSGDTIVLIDFDVANYHWFITDISIALQNLLFGSAGGMDRPLASRAALRDFLDVFMQGYETENHLEAFWLGKIDLFVQYRRMLLFTVMQGWLNKKPSARAAWKKMILNDPPVLGI